MPKPLCPKCRALGLETDCTDRMIHAHAKQRSMNGEDLDYRLEVTVVFDVPVTSTLPLDPFEMATRMRETWMDDDIEFTKLLADVPDLDYDLRVVPVFE